MNQDAKNKKPVNGNAFLRDANGTLHYVGRASFQKNGAVEFMVGKVDYLILPKKDKNPEEESA